MILKTCSISMLMGAWKKTIFSAAFLLALFLSGFGSSALASTASHNHLSRGHTLLSDGHFEKALSRFQQAVKADPHDGKAHFFAGVALNRLGRHREALGRFEKAKLLGFSGSEMLFESGWAFLGTGDWNGAITRLQAFEKKNPGRGQTSEFTGRAYLGLKNYKKAEKYLLQALDRDPSLSGSVLFYLSVVATKRGQKSLAGERVRQFVNDEAASPIARAFLGKEKEGRVASKKKEKKGGVNATFAGGYSNNAISLGHGIALPTDITRQSSAFGRTALGTFYRLLDKNKDTLTLSGRFLTDFYASSTRLSLYDYFGSANYRHKISEKAAMGLLVSNEFSQIHRANFRNQTNSRLALGWRAADWLVTEFSYMLGLGNYFPQTTAAQDRDNVAHTGAWNNFFSIKGTKFRGRFGYYYVNNNADGNDFDFQTHGALLSISRPLFGKLTGEVLYSRYWNRYAKVNSLPGFAFKRKDNTDMVTAQISAPLFGESVKSYYRYSFINQYSNINFYNFTQHVGSAGLTFDLI